MSVLLAKKPWTVILGVGGRRDANGYFLPDERTIFRNECIRELNKLYPWASTVEQKLFLEGFDRGEQFALRTGKQELET